MVKTAGKGSGVKGAAVERHGKVSDGQHSEKCSSIASILKIRASGLQGMPAMGGSSNEESLSNEFQEQDD